MMDVLTLCLIALAFISGLVVGRKLNEDRHAIEISNLHESKNQQIEQLMADLLMSRQKSTYLETKLNVYEAANRLGGERVIY